MNAAKAALRYSCVDITPHLNSVIATYDHNRSLGRLNAWGNSFPAEELPFGGTLTIDGVPFRLASKAVCDLDNVEPLDHTIVTKSAVATVGIAFLGCGEMGDQTLTGRFRIPGRPDSHFSVVAKGAMVPGERPVGPDGLKFSHLHYPGDYELNLLAAAVWSFEYRWPVPFPVAALELDSNPLVHLLAITLLTEVPCAGNAPISGAADHNGVLLR